MPSNNFTCDFGYFLFDVVFCAPCPPHTIGLDGLTCLRCPGDEYALGFGNTACTPCLNSNISSDPIACPVLVPEFYYTAASTAGLAMLLGILFIAALCMLQRQTVKILALRLKDAAVRLAGYDTQPATYRIMDTALTIHDQVADNDDDEIKMPDGVENNHAVLDLDGDDALPTDSAMAATIDFIKTPHVKATLVVVKPALNED